MKEILDFNFRWNDERCRFDIIRQTLQCAPMYAFQMYFEASLNVNPDIRT